MPQIIAVFGLLVLLSIGGGIGVSSVAQPEETGRVLVSGGETSSIPTTQTTNTTVPTPITSQPTVAEVLDTRLPKITTLAAQNITANSATARALANAYDQKVNSAYIIYGYDERRVRAVAAEYQSFSVISEFTDDKVRAMSIDTYVSKEETYTTYLSSLVGDTTYFYTYCLEYEHRAICGAIRTLTTVEKNYRGGYFYQPSLYTSRLTDIEAYSANITGSYQMNDGKDGIVFLVYGTSRTLVEAMSLEEDYASVDEDGEALQTARLATRVIGKGEFAYTMNNLDRDTEYFYRVCAEYENNEDSGMTCSYTNSFTTDRRDQSEKPEAADVSAVVAGTIATLSGSITMNDFNDGHAFFIYGTNKSYVEGVNTSYGFDWIYQYGDTLQKVSLNTNVDSDKNFSKIVRDLAPSSTYYYRLCAEYEDENDYGYNSLYLSCSDVKSFTTGI